MNNLNLKSFLLAGAALLLNAFILAFPLYILFDISSNHINLLIFILPVTAFIPFWLTKIRKQSGFITLTSNLVLLSIAYGSALTILFHQMEQWSTLPQALCLVSTIAAIYIAYIIHNPYLRILSFIATIISFQWWVILEFEYISTIYLILIDAVILLLISLLPMAAKYYNFIIALSITIFLYALFQIAMPNMDTTHSLFNESLLLIFFSVMIIGIAFYLQSRSLHVIGLLSLISSLFAYYYNLDDTLNMKGIILMSSGISILIMRFIYLKWRKHYAN